MRYYLVHCDYDAAAWRDLLNQKQVSVKTRLDPVRDLARRFGGDFVDLAEKDDEGNPVICKWLSFGAHDLVGIVKMPTPEDARGFSMVVSSHQGVRSFEIMPLLSMSEGIDAMQKGYANKGDYTVPGDSGG